MHWLGCIARRDPNLFLLWQLGVRPEARRKALVLAPLIQYGTVYKLRPRRTLAKRTQLPLV